MRLLFHLSGLSVASGKDREMKTPKEFDYDLWIAEDGRYMVRVKATREECAVSQAVFRKLRAEEKKLRREMDMHKSPRPCIEDSPAKVRLVSLDYVSASDDDLTAAWLIDPSDFEQDLLLRESIHELRAQLTERQLEVFERCMLGGMSTYTLERWYKQQVRFRTAADREKEADALKASYSMPEMAHLLGIQRDTVYRILAKKDSTFEMVVIAGQKRVTASSFEAWYQSQSHYQKVVAVQEPVPLEEEPAADEPTAGLSDAENETAAEHVQAKSVYRVCDLQRALGISRKAVYRKIQAREIKTMLVGKEYLISPAEFERITGGDKDGNHHSQE